MISNFPAGFSLYDVTVSSVTDFRQKTAFKSLNQDISLLKHVIKRDVFVSFVVSHVWIPLIPDSVDQNQIP